MIIYGKQLFLHVLRHHKEMLEEIYLAKELEKPLFSELAKSNVKIIKVDARKAQALARGGNHQGLLAKITPFKPLGLSDLKNKNNIAILYNLSDVGNIGAIVRSAYALGIESVLVVGKSLAMEGVLRASSGAAFELPIALHDDGLGALNELRHAGFTIYATASNGNNVRSYKFNQKFALVLGSEGEGLPKKVLERCDDIIGIKLAHDWDSLNVSAAFAIICDRIMNG